MSTWALAATVFVVLLVYVGLYLRESHRLQLERQEHAKTRAELAQYRDVELVTSTARLTTVAYTRSTTIGFAVALEQAIKENKPVGIGHEIGLQWLPDIEPGKVRIVIQQYGLSYDHVTRNLPDDGE